MCRAYTKEEIREEFLDQIRTYIWYWSKLEDDFYKTRKDILEGFTNSILSIIDGVTNLPAFDLVVRPHPDDKQYCIDNEENWHEDGMIINNDTMLHEIMYRKEK